MIKPPSSHGSWALHLGSQSGHNPNRSKALCLACRCRPKRFVGPPLLRQVCFANFDHWQLHHHCSVPIQLAILVYIMVYRETHIVQAAIAANFREKRAGDCGKLAWDMAANCCKTWASRQMGKILTTEKHSWMIHHNTHDQGWDNDEKMPASYVFRIEECQSQNHLSFIGSHWFPPEVHWF
jgi:hypothetical protein